ncbi:MAG TPA: cytochrome c biogenesis protein CcsA [Gemmatimonadales bacterium]|nr:cytochrome c biogenesis protein CcsA [Gemmatimonadales bacterium]
MLFALHLAALGLYGLSAALALAPFAGVSIPRRWTLGVATLGAVLHGVGVTQLTLVGLGPALSMLALCLMLLQIGSDLLLRAGTVALFTAPLAGGLVGLALLLGLAPGAEPSAGRNLWFILHVTLSVLGLALLALAFISAALYLWQFRELKAKRFGQVFQLFPPLERLDRLNHVALVAGFPALTIGVLLAIGYAVRYAGGMHVDPAQVVWGSFTWGVLGWTVWVRVARRWAGRRAAFASIAGFTAVVLVYVALKLAQPGTERFL